MGVVRRPGGRIAIAVRRSTVAEQTDDVDAYWRSRTPEERVAAVEELRQQLWGDELDAVGGRLQRVHRVVERG